MGAERVCSECGAPLPENAPGGRCPKCLLQLGLEDEQEAVAQARAAEGNEPELPLEQPGTQIGRYRLVQQIGEGGFGVVFMAEQIEPVLREVALKIIKPGMDTRQVVARFEAERQALARMDHPNIAKVLDAGATAQGRPYFVMELVEGVRITEYCDQHSLPTRQRLDLFLHVCRAMQHAHQKGIIHRDIKPSNILVTEQDGAALPKVIDFGIAKATHGRLSDASLMTGSGRFVGTPAYMSPEQCLIGTEAAADIDTRSDIYSLGVLLYELLVGQAPFGAREFEQVEPGEIWRVIREKEPQRPSTKLSGLSMEEQTTVARLRGSEPFKLAHIVRGDLDWIVMKCLEKDRARRYETVNGLSRDIERHLSNEPVVARPPSKVYSFQKMVRRNKVAVSTCAVFLMILLIGVAAVIWQAIRATKAEHNATEKLWASYLSEARARRRSGEFGQRFDSLIALSNAAAIKPSLELRNEAIACLTLADFRLIAGRGKNFKAMKESVVLDPVMKRYAVGRQDGTISIRSFSDDKELFVLPAMGGAVRLIRFTPNGQTLVAHYPNNTYRFWDLGTQTVRLEHSLFRGGFSISPDCRRICLMDGQKAAICDFARPEDLKPVRIDQPLSNAGPFDRDARFVALYLLSHTDAAVYDIERGMIVATLSHPTDLTMMEFNPDGRHLAVACRDNLIYIWDVPEGKRVRTLQGMRGNPSFLRFSHDGRFLLSGADNGRIVLWESASGHQLLSIPRVGIGTFALDDHVMVVRDWEATSFESFEFANMQALQTIYNRGSVPGAPEGGAVFNPTGSLLAFETESGGSLWDIRAGREFGRVEQPGLRVYSFASDGQCVLGIDSQRRVFRWPLQEPTGVGTVLVGHLSYPGSGAVGTKAFSAADGKVWAVLESFVPSTNRLSYCCQVFCPDTMTEVCRTDPQELLGFEWAALSPDHNLLATVSKSENRIKIWDAHSGSLRRTLPSTGNGPFIAFSPDGQRFVAGSIEDYQFYEVATWLPELRIGIPQSDKSSTPVLAFSPDGRILASSFDSTKVRLLNAIGGQILAELEAPDAWTITHLAFSPDGTRLAVCEGHSALRLWDLRYIREELARMHLDWNLPPYPPEQVEAAHVR